jgi:hypothetical protein
MPLKLFHKQHRLAPGMEFILAHLRALFQEVLLDVLHFDHLVTLPAGGQHRALLPIVDVQGLLGEVGVVHTAEVTGGLGVAGFLVVMGLMGWLLLLYWSTTLYFLGFSLASSDVSFNSLLRSLLNFLWLLSWYRGALSIDLSKLGQKCIKGSLSDSFIIL